jgi:hypothetical protein
VEAALRAAHRELGFVIASPDAPDDEACLPAGPVIP